MTTISTFKLFHDRAQDAARDMIAHGIQGECIVTDPPYKLTSGGNTKHPDSMSGGWIDDYANTGEIIDCDIEWDEVAQICFNLLREGHAYIMANSRNVQPLLNSAENAGFGFHNLLIWDKRTATPNRWYMKNLEFTAFLFKGKAKRINDCSAKQLISCPQIDESEHPTEKPVQLMRYYIENSTQPGDTVIDPFCGTGTTGVAAILSGRNFIGIESNEKWYNVAKARLEEAQKQASFEPSLF